MGGTTRRVVGGLLPVVAALGVMTFGVGGILAAAIIGGSALVGGLVAGSDISITDLNKQEQSTRFNTIDTQRTISVIYGKRLVGSNDIFFEMSDIEEEEHYLWLVSCLAEGECDSINQIEYGDPPELVDEIYVNGKLISEYDPEDIIYYFHNGTNNQVVDSHIHEAISKYTDPLINTVYLVYKINTNKFPGVVPRREVVLKGLKIYDVRTETTIWSRNPAIILYDYLTNSRYGLNWDAANLDINSWIAAANYCDSRGWKIDYEIGAQVKSQTVIENILGHFRGTLSYYGGKFYLYVSDLGYEPEVFTIKDEHIARDESGKALVSVSEPSRYSLPEGAVIKYVNAEHGRWTYDDIPIGEKYGQILPLEFPAFTDRGLALNMGAYILERARLNKSFSVTLRPDTVVLDINDVIRFTCSELLVSNILTRVKSSTMMQNGLVQINLVEESPTLYDYSYQDTSISYVVDVDNFYSTPPPVSNIEFEESTYTYRERSYVRLLIKWSPPYTEGSYVASSGDISSGPEDNQFTLTSELDFTNIVINSKVKVSLPGYQTYRVIAKQEVSPGIWVLTVDRDCTGHPLQSFEYNLPSYFSWYDYSEVSVSESVEGPYTIIGFGDIRFQMDPAEEGTTYYFKIVAVSYQRLFSTPIYTSYEVTGLSESHPQSPKDLTVSESEGTVYAYTNDIYDPILPDLSGWEFRMSPLVDVDWWGALYLSLEKEPSVVYTNIIPGSHKIWLNTLGTNNLYGETPVWRTINLIDPPFGSILYDSVELDYSTGVHDNTELIEVGGEYRLQCAHTGGVLEGSWTSDEITLDRLWQDAGGKLSCVVGLTHYLSDFGDWEKIQVGAKIKVDSDIVNVIDKSLYSFWVITDEARTVVGAPSLVEIGSLANWARVPIGAEFKFEGATDTYFVRSKTYVGPTSYLELDGDTDETVFKYFYIKYPLSITVDSIGSWYRKPFQYSLEPNDLLTYVNYNYVFDGPMEPYQTFGNFKIIIYYSTTSGGPYDLAEGVEIFYAITTGLYIKVKFEIIDPNIAVHLQVRPQSMLKCGLRI